MLYIFFQYTIHSHSEDEIVSLFAEFEQKSTKEASFVAELDKLEMIMQANEYEKGL